MENVKLNNSPLALYDAVKNYFLFYFPDYTTQYYLSQEINNLYEILLNKNNNPITIRWEQFIKDFKKKYSEYKVYNLHSNYPSWTMKIVMPPKEDIIEFSVYISISLIGPFYVFFMEEKKMDDIRLYIAPYGIYEDLFKQMERHIEETFPEYKFLNWAILSMNFFNLVSPGINTANRENGQPDKKISVLKGLFFDFEVDQEGFFARVGDHLYKSKDNFLLEIDPQKLQSMKQILNDKRVAYQEIY